MPKDTHAIIKLLAVGSHFELVPASQLPDKVILQIWPEDFGEYEKEACFLCEVAD